MADDAIAELLRWLDARSAETPQTESPPLASPPTAPALDHGAIDDSLADELDLWASDDVPDFLDLGVAAPAAGARPFEAAAQPATTGAITQPRGGTRARDATRPLVRRAGQGEITDLGRQADAIATCRLSALAARLETHGDVLRRLDGDAAWVVLTGLQRAAGAGAATPHGALCDLLRRAVTSPDIALAALGFDVASRLRATAVQDVIAAQLRDRAADLGFDGVERALASLAELGDGRCVRTMEEALLRQASALTEHQAWRARHIVQLIRRDHRR